MTAHTWRFLRAGGFDQVVLSTAEDLRQLATLDQKLWVALACPVKGNELDEMTLCLVDTDDDGRIRAPELLEAIAWVDGKLLNLDTLLDGHTSLTLSNIADDTLRSSAEVVLAGLEKSGEDRVTVEDTTGAMERLNAMPFNGDGVVPASATADGEVSQVIDDIVEATGGALDRNGEQGVTAELLETFWTALTGYEAWWREAEEGEDAVVPLGDGTAAAVEAFTAVRAKVEDYFTRCELAAFDPRSLEHLAGAEARWAKIAPRTLSRTDDDIQDFPLAHITPQSDLPLTAGINPAWAGPVDAFLRLVVTPLIGPIEVLSRAQWVDLEARFAAYESWFARKTGTIVEPLGIERVRTLLGSEHRAAVASLIAQDTARRPEADALLDVVRVTRYNRDLFTLAHNFASFRAFYDREQKAMFQAGTLYLDGRSCDLVVRVEDIAKHAATGPQSYLYIAYCQCTRKSTGESMNIAAAFTDGDADFLAVGRNGLFYDRQGRDWDATITKVVEQPISIRQAFWAPYKRLVRFISDQAEKFAGDQEKASSSAMEAKAGAGVEQLKAAPGAARATAPTASGSAFDIGKFAGIFAAVGLALGFMVSAASMLVAGFLSLRLWQMPLALLAVVLLFSGPSMLLAAFKLSRRNLAPVLDANGWAINTRARINLPFGATLTQVAALPAGATREMKDPYKEKRRPWWLYATLLVLVCLVAFTWDMGLGEFVRYQITALSAQPPASSAP